MTITREPVHIAPPRVDVHIPRRNIRIDTTFWQHRSIFAGSQEQLNRLRREADERAAARTQAAGYVQSERVPSQPSISERHRPVVRRLKPVLHVGLVPLLWAITTCKCGDRWPCNDVKQYLRRRFGWTTDITGHLKTLTDDLPKPSTRWTRLRRLFSRRSTTADHSPSACGVPHSSCEDAT